jgi:two-component system, LytTR family, response regulator
MRTLIVDDEPIARQILREELERFPEIEIAGEAEDGASALAAIAQFEPDVVFLDLQMPGEGGFEVIRRLPQGRGKPPVIVIVTAYDQHAIEAFEAGAVDYLLKPVSRERLTKSLERAAQLLARESDRRAALTQVQQAAELSTDVKTRRIAGRLGEEYVLLSPEEVLAFQAEHDLVWIITARQKYLATQSLRAIEERLQGSTFRRVHRNAIVNIAHIRKMSALSSQRWILTLRNSMEFVVSKRQARTVRDLLQW